MSKLQNIKIIGAQPEDAKTVKAIEIACGLSPWTVESYKAETTRDDSVLLIARSGAKDLGFISGRIIKAPTGEAEIHNIGVLPEYRKQGIGSLLIGEFQRISGESGAGAVWIEVRESNAEALAFYEAHRFVAVGRRKDFYSGPVEDAVLMCLKLPNA